MARTSGGEDRAVNVNNGNARTATVSGLNSNTLYTISVAAVTSAGTGPATTINVATPGKYVLYILNIHYSPNPKYSIFSLHTRWIHCVCLKKFSKHLVGTC